MISINFDENSCSEAARMFKVYNPVRIRPSSMTRFTHIDVTPQCKLGVLELTRRQRCQHFGYEIRGVHHAGRR